jgi:hypothetical protein
MDLDYYVRAVLSPHFVGTMIVAGLGYGYFLWALNVRDSVRLYGMAVVPGLAFLSFVFLSRLAGQGNAIALYPLLMVDWLIFSNTAFVSVVIRRHLARRRGTGGKG